MDKRKILEELLRGNTEPLLRAKEEAKKDIIKIWGHWNEQETPGQYSGIRITLHSGKTEDYPILTKAEYQKLEERFTEDAIPLIWDFSYCWD